MRCCGCHHQCRRSNAAATAAPSTLPQPHTGLRHHGRATHCLSSPSPCADDRTAAAPSAAPPPPSDARGRSRAANSTSQPPLFSIPSNVINKRSRRRLRVWFRGQRVPILSSSTFYKLERARASREPPLSCLLRLSPTSKYGAHIHQSSSRLEQHAPRQSPSAPSASSLRPATHPV